MKVVDAFVNGVVTLSSRHGGASPRPPRGTVMFSPMGDRDAPTHPLVGITVGHAHNILRESERGVIYRLQDLYDDMRERDAWLDAVCRTRILALAGKPWRIEPSDSSPDAARSAEMVANLLDDHIPVAWAIESLQEAVLRGLSVLEMEWLKMPTGEVVPRLHWRHSGLFAWNEEYVLTLADQSGQPGDPLEDYGADRWVVHMPHGGRAAIPPRRGALRSCIFPALVKRYALRWWLRAAERFGQPAPLVYYPEGSSEAVRNAAVQALRALSEDWALALTDGFRVDTVPGTGAFDGAGHSGLVSAMEERMTLAILGQTLTTSAGQVGSYALGQVHDRVRGDYMASDARSLEETIRDQLIAPIVRYNWPRLPVPRFRFELLGEGPPLVDEESPAQKRSQPGSRKDQKVGQSQQDGAMPVGRGELPADKTREDEDAA